MSASELQRGSPYQGLIPYDEADAPFFFGREKEARLIIANLYASPLTLLYGASGVGKSSVLRAGVAHQLRTREELLIVVFNAWQSNPINDLKSKIAKAAERVGVSIDPAADSLSLADYLAAASAQLERRLMIILDQFEEYFLYHPQEDEFASEFSRAVTQSQAPVSFLISIREDFYAKLDRFEGRIPTLYDNYLRIEHLDRPAARVAIEKPIAEYNRLYTTNGQFSIEPGLVEAVLRQVETGRVIIGEAGRGVVETAGLAEEGAARIETPFLQLVMTRLWEQESGTGSHNLRLQTLDDLGGAENIVRTHLDGVITKLSEREQEIAAGIFHYLVTPSGTKIAYTASDLAGSAELKEAEVVHVLDKLSHGDVRILRTVEPSPDRPTSPRYEIFHDVLAPAILTWRTAYVQTQERADAERQAEEQRHEAAERARIAEKVKTAGRLRWLSVSLALMTLLALVTAAYAFKQRSRAVADAGQAQAQAKEAIAARAAAEEQRGLAEEQRKRADEQAKEAETARGKAEEERQRADEQAGLARARAAEADKARGEAVAARGVAESERQRANQQAAIAKSRELAAAARTTLNSDPELSVLLALRAVSEFTSESLTEQEKQGIKEIEKKEAIESLHEAVQASRVRQTLAGHDGEVKKVAYALKGRRVITHIADGMVKLWDAESGKWLRDLSNDANKYGLADNSYKYGQIELSHDGLRVAIPLTGGAVQVRDVASGESVRTLPADDEIIEGMAFSKDGSTLAVARARELRLWNIATGQAFELPYGQYNTFSRTIEILTFSVDDRTLVAGGCTHADRAGCTALDVKAWDVTTRQEARPPVTLSFGNFKKLRRAFSPNGERLFTVINDGTAKVWDATSGKELFDLSSEHAVSPAAFSGDGKIFAALTKSGAIMLWDASTGAQLRTLDGQFSKATSLVFSPDGKRIAAFSKGAVKMWDAASGHELLTLSGHKDAITSIAFSPDGAFIATASNDRTAKLWDISPEKELLTLFAEGEWIGIGPIVFSSDGTRLAGVSGGAAKLWDANTGTELLSLKDDGLISAFDYSHDGKHLATVTNDKTVRIWDTTSRQNTMTITAEAGQRVNDVAVSPRDGKLLATADQDKTARIWDAATGRELHKLSGHTNEVYRVAFSPNGEYIATGSFDKTAKVWDVKTGRELHTLVGHDGGVWRVAFSSDGKRLATASGDGYAKIWDVSTGLELTYLSGHNGDVLDVTFSPDGRLIATAGNDQTAKVWDASTGLELLSLTGHASSVSSVAFSPDGLRLVTSGGNSARVYTLDVQKLISLAQERVSRHELTVDERKRYLHEVPKP